MMPDNALSSSVIVAPYLSPDDEARTLLTDFEQGGTALNDPSDGLLVQRWTLSYATPDVIVTPDSGGSTVLFSFANITEISLAFDQNMNPFVAYVLNGDAWYWWYDPLTAQQEHVQMALGVSSPRCCMDDKRDHETPRSDILLAYMKNGELHTRVQRDRFSVEYPQGYLPDVDFTFYKIGMAVNNRIMFEFAA